jgi:hypothetical protein
LTACPASSPAYSILVLRVTAPGHRQPVFVSIGLTGNGMTAEVDPLVVELRDGLLMDHTVTL